MIFRSRKHRGGASALADPGAAGAQADIDALFDEIDTLAAQNWASRDAERERRMLRLRHQAGAALLAGAGARPDQPEPAFEALADGSGGGLPDIDPADLTPELLRAGILRDGCLLVRGLIDREAALRLADDVDRAFEERNTLVDGGSVDNPHYEEFEPDPPFVLTERQWIRDGGGVLAADCPKLMFAMLDLFDRAGLRGVIADYLGEHPAMSVNKSTLRKVRATDGGAWHQDGAFMGDVRALNVWLSLSHCGDDAPGLDVVPHRIDQIVETGSEGAVFDWSVAPAVAERAAGDGGTLRPIFEPGDVLLFDELFLHSTAIDPAMPNTRYAVESWFFGPSAFPGDYVPLAL
jgi:hypothetical protein